MSERQIRRDRRREIKREERRERRFGARTKVAAGAGAALGATVLFAPAAQAGTFTVTTTSDTDELDGTLREEIEDANASAGADTITFASTVTGTINLLAGSGGTIEIDDPLTITGPGASVLAVDANYDFRIFYANVDGALAISGLTLREGLISGPVAGAALYSTDSDVTLTGTVFDSNISEDADGGALLIDDGDLTIADSTFENNFAYEGGGALYGPDSSDYSITITNSAFLNNTAFYDDGGALYSGSSDLSITGSTFYSNFAYEEGGAFYASGDEVDVSISSSSFTYNDTYTGGGAAGFVDGVDATLTVTGSDVSNNTADGWGGAFYTDEADVAIQASNLSGNSADDGGGGAVYVADTNENDLAVDITDSVLNDNYAGQYGGALYAGGASNEDYDVSLTLQRTTIAGNAADYAGGGVLLYDTNLLVDRSTISGNIADPEDSSDSREGGGLLLWGPQDSAVFQNSTVSGNSGADYGGGIYLYQDDDDPDGAGTADISINNSTIVGNEAETSGGGVFLYDHEVDLSSTIVANNSAPDGADLGGDFDPPDGGDATFTTGFSLIEDPTVSDGSTLAQSPAGSNITGVDPALGPLANNGGPTQTHAPALGSPAIDQGVANGLTTDQRGLARTGDLSLFPNAAGGDGTDIGSVEIQAADCQGSGALKLDGTAGDDTITGTDGPDAISGLAGNDAAQGAGGNDCVNGDEGRDNVKGGPGKDLVKGGAGKDKGSGGGGKDKVKGNAGKDKLKGGGGKDRVSGQGGKDKLSGGGGKDRLKGGPGKDKIKTGGGKDKVNCGGGKDKVTADAKDKVSQNCEKVIEKG